MGKWKNNFCVKPKRRHVLTRQPPPSTPIAADFVGQANKLKKNWKRKKEMQGNQSVRAKEREREIETTLASSVSFETCNDWMPTHTHKGYTHTHVDRKASALNSIETLSSAQLAKRRRQRWRWRWRWSWRRCRCRCCKSKWRILCAFF